MYVPPQAFFCSDNFPSLTSFLKESGPSRFSVCDGCSGWNSAWITNRAALFTRYIQCFSSDGMVMMSTMNPSIDASMTVISTARGSACTIWFVNCCLSSFVSKYMCSEFRSYISQDLYWSISFTMSIVDSLIVVYSAGAGVVPEGNHRHRKASLSNIAMKFDEVVAFAWIQRQAASRSDFTIKIHFVGHLLCIAQIMCSILIRQKP